MREPITMSMPGRKSKKLPVFGDFIRQSKHSQVFEEIETWASGLILGGTIVAGWFAWRFIGWFTIPAMVLIGAPTIAWLATMLTNRVKNKSPEEIERLKMLSSHMRALRSYLDSGRLHRHIQPVAAALFEESARNWQRIQEALKGPAWSQPSLPQHWKSVREQSLSAAELAMEDLVLLLQTSIVAQPKNEEWQVVFGEFLQSLIGQENTVQQVDHFPAEYEAARAIAWKLQSLAVEVETASKKLLLDDGVKKQFSSNDSIDFALSELKAIQQAEEELHERLNS